MRIWREVPPTQAFLISTLWVLAGCQTGALPVAEVDFVPRNLAVGEGPSAVAAADLDNDGHQDLVVVNELSQDLSLFRGDGQGGMVSLGRVQAGENPTDVALADLDADGAFDMVVANHETRYLTILVGDGKGAFRPAPNSPLTIEVSPHPHVVKASDLDGDGHLDLVVDNRDGRGLLILRGTGGGAFESPGKLVDVGGDPYRGMAIGDINHDGQLDLTTPNSTAVGIVLSENAKKLLFLPPRFVATAAPFAVELADIDGDSHLDVIAALDEESTLVEVFLGDGRGGFRPSPASPFQGAPGAKMIARGDFNGDGVQDAAVAGFQSPEVLLLLGGAHSIATARLRGGKNPWGMTAADFNEDGRDDLVLADNAQAQVALYLSSRK